jgi:predicted 2-oxoglutarate/Fe(II)-dependent dioxygenase YbiX
MEKFEFSMGKNLEDYIKIYDVIDLDLCKKLITKLKKSEWQSHTWQSYGGVTPKNLGEEELTVSYAINAKNENAEIMKAFYTALGMYIKDINMPWFSGWAGYTQVRYNRYQEKNIMDIHCDHIYNVFDGQRKGIPTLSIVGGLNNNYDGGRFTMFEDMEIDIKAGQVLIFPSLFLYPHRVKPVTKGMRYSCVSWVW